MGVLSNIFDLLGEATGLPTPRDAQRAHERMVETVDAVRDRLGLPTSKDVDEAIDRADRWWEDLGDRTGLPTHHDVDDRIDDAREWVNDKIEDVLDELPPVPGDDERDDDEGDDDEGDDDWPAWPWLGVAAGWLVHRVLSHELDGGFDFELEIPAFEIDGFTVEDERPYVPGPPFAARVGDPMLHAGTAIPGPGESKVLIGGKPALTSADRTVCPMIDPSGAKHSDGLLLSSNDTVFVGGVPLVRAGDYAVEIVGGPNPIIAGCPTVYAGKRAPPVMVLEVRHKPLSELVPGLERIGYSGGKVKANISGSIELGDAMGWAAFAGYVLGTGGAGAGHVGVAAALLDFPELSFDVEADTGRIFAETRNDIELPNGDTRIVRDRVDHGLGKIEVKGKVEPSFPKVWKSKVEIGKTKYTPGGTRHQRKTHGADEPAPEWKE